MLLQSCVFNIFYLFWAYWGGPFFIDEEHESLNLEPARLQLLGPSLAFGFSSQPNPAQPIYPSSSVDSPLAQYRSSLGRARLLLERFHRFGLRSVHRLRERLRGEGDLGEVGRYGLPPPPLSRSVELILTTLLPTPRARLLNLPSIYADGFHFQS